MLVHIIFTCFAVSAAIADILPEALQPRTSGQDIVMNVNENIRKVFSDDHMYMDRIACVESNNGLDLNTYRDGYYGGIYQVDRIGFEDTKDVASHPGLSSKYDKIMEEFRYRLSSSAI